MDFNHYNVLKFDKIANYISENKSNLLPKIPEEVNLLSHIFKNKLVVFQKMIKFQ